MRKVLFWMHLCTGCVAGLVVLIMSVTGVALTYEKQMVRWFDRQALSARPQGTAPLPAEALLERVREQKGSLPSSVTWRNSAAEPVLLSYGREGQAYADAATGAILGAGNTGARKFFRAMTDWHRWLGQEGPGRTTGRAITGACNLAFLFIVVSGLYLWFPREWTRRHFAPILWFRGGLGGKPRDFNWHNVIGFWRLVPLFVVVLSGAVISYPWASNLVYTLAGSQPPAQTRGGGKAGEGKGKDARRGEGKGEGVQAARGGSRPAGPPGLGAAPPATLPLDGINTGFDRARTARKSWEAITLRLPSPERAPIVFSVDEGGPGQGHLRSTVTLARETGAVTVLNEYDTYDAGRKARIWLRFAHTGEVYGMTGQTIAGLASLGGVFLVYTGVALSLRRFAAWRRRRVRAVECPEEAAA